jgi:hypothetical protein
LYSGGQYLLLLIFISELVHLKTAKMRPEEFPKDKAEPS